MRLQGRAVLAAVVGFKIAKWTAFPGCCYSASVRRVLGKMPTAQLMMHMMLSDAAHAAVAVDPRL